MFAVIVVPFSNVRSAHRAGWQQQPAGNSSRRVTTSQPFPAASREYARPVLSSDSSDRARAMPRSALSNAIAVVAATSARALSELCRVGAPGFRRSRSSDLGARPKSQISTMKRAGDSGHTTKKPRLEDEPAGGLQCVTSGSTHQADLRYVGGGQQCTANALIAGTLSTILNRRELSVDDINLVLSCGDALYVALEPMIPADVYPRHLSTDELPSEVRVGDNVVTIENQWVANGLYPENDSREAIAGAFSYLVRILTNDVFNNDSHNDYSDTILFTGQGYTISFWRFNNRFYLFNSHAVDEMNKGWSGGVARLFRCKDLESLAKELLTYNCTFVSGQQYALCRVRVISHRPVENVNALSQSVQFAVVSQTWIGSNDTVATNCKKATHVKNSNNCAGLQPVVVNDKVDDLKLSVLKPVVVPEPLATSSGKSGPAKKMGRPKKKPRGPKKTKEDATHVKNSNNCPGLQPVVVNDKVDDFKLSVLKPVVVLEPLATSSEKSGPAVKMGRPKKKTRGPKKTKENAHLEAAQRYVEKKPEIHNAAAKKYAQKNPEINKAAAKKYSQEKPEVHRAAVHKYTQENPDVNKKSVEKYDATHPEKKKESVERYNKNSRNVDAPLRRSHNLIAQKRGAELEAVPAFSLKKPCLDSGDIYVCPHCGARLFEEERSRVQWCCGSGAYNVQNLAPLTEDFYTHPAFVQRPRAYNNLFAFSALGVTHGFQQPTGIAFLKIQGRVYHRVFDLGYEQSVNNIGLYINDCSEREDLALGRNLDLTVTRSITNYLNNVNPHIECFKRLSLETAPEAFIMFEKTSRATHGNILGDQPVGREVSAIICTDREQYRSHCIAVWKIGLRKAHTVDIMHTLYESFQYPLLYPEGNAGWYPGKMDNNDKKLTQVKYVRCLLLSEARFSKFGRLSEEWLVDMYCRISEERLRYLTNMQNKNTSNDMRAAPLQELLNDETIAAEGVVPGRIYLPSTFTGGPRYMKLKYLDCIALVDRLGPPSYFITFTCNPNWPEIKQTLQPGERADPLICSRVFNLRLTALIRDLRSGLWFGKVQYLTYVIEFQKRGLPHAHICFRVEGGGPIQSIDIDKVCRADIPDESEVDGRLRKAVLNHMIHGPCGGERDNLPCYNKEKQICTKRFPKRETDVTFSDERGFIHLRRNSNNEGIIKYRNREITVNDLWVVPYNAALLLKYDAHINVEISSHRSVIKYLFKYMTKGPDEARVAVVMDDDAAKNEIEEYVTKRYIGSSDAAWRVLEFDVTSREPNVKQLSVHLKDRQTVIFRPNNVDEAVNRGGSDMITYFHRPPGDQFENLTYLDFYEKYIVHSKRPATKNVQIFETTNGKFVTARQRNELITRLYWVDPKFMEQFFLRVLIARFPCRSYDDLLHLGGPDCSSFQEAAKAQGLADNEVEYEGALQEASTFKTGPALRRFFVLLASNGAPAATLWNKFKEKICEDWLERLPNDKVNAYKHCLRHINRMLLQQGTSLSEQGLPEVEDNTTELQRERMAHDELPQMEFVVEWLPKLSSEQRVIYDYIHRLFVDKQYRDRNPSAIFIDGPAGTGKTLLLNVITAHVRGDLSGVVLCTASSAIAAQNHDGGVTAHSMFKFPIDIADDSGYWGITNKSQRGELISNADVIIYDEAPMAHKYLIHLLDRSLRDLMNSNKIFGGKIVIFAGDFRQIPPVVVNARSNSDILNSSVKTSPLWQKLKTFSLLASQRCKDDPEYAEFLLKLGSNELPSYPIQVGEGRVQDLTSLGSIETVTELNDLINFVFPWMVIDEPDVCSHRAILCTRNDSVRAINSNILDRVPGEMLHFYSCDKVESENADQLYLGPDALNRLQPPGVPAFDLKLKIGCVCMIIRNLSFADGLVNGTKVIIVGVSPFLIRVRKPGGFDDHPIPRILFKAAIARNSPFEMLRRQFPLQVSYAMTIHKSQGQTIERVGVDLRSDVFSHGQLYVALGRVRERRNIKVLLHPERIQNDVPYANNVVIPELLQ